MDGVRELIDAQQMKKSTYNLMIFTVSKMISAVGANILAFGISLYILKMTGSATSFAINMICTILPRILLSPVVGYMADTFSKKKIIIISQVMIVMTIIGLLIYSEINGLTITAIYIMTVFYSIFGAFSGITLTASIGSLIAPNKIQKAMSLNQTAVSIAAIAAPIIGGFLFGTVSIEVFLIIQITAYTLSTILDSTMNFNLFSTVEEGLKKEKVSMLVSMKSAVSYVSKSVTLKSVMILSLWLNLFFSAISVGSAFILVEKLKLNSIDVGWVEAAGASGMLLASLYFTFRKKIENPIWFSKNSLIALSLSIVLMAVPLIYPIVNYTLLVIYCMGAFMIQTAMMIFTNIPIGIMFQKTIVEEFRGRVFALMDSMAMAMMPIGSLIYGVLYDLIDAQYVIVCTSVILLALTLGLLRPRVLNQIQLEQDQIHEDEEVLQG